MNGYAYANNSPVSKSDPSGLCPVDLCGGGEGKGGATNGEVTKPAKSSPVYQELPYEHVVPGTSKRQIFPGVYIKKSFPGWQKVRNRFYDLWLGTMNSSYYTPEYLSNTQDPNQQRQVQQWLYNACRGGKDCPEGTTLSFMQVVAGGIFSFGFNGRGGLAVPARGRAGKPDGCNCFLAGTDVLMADGTAKDIEEVEIGDVVRATDPETGETGPREVTRLIRTDSDKKFNELSLATEDGLEKLTATHEHPFWSPSEQDWIEAGDLRKGMTLLTDEGDTVIVTGNRPFTKHARTYNLTVDGLHTYYVLAGATPVLVHNSNGCPTGRLSDPLPRGMNNKIASAYDDVKAGRIPSHDTYSGREHPWWAGSKEYRVPGRPETDRILEKELPNGVKVYGWTSTHYTKIQRFSAPHFPDSGWN